MVPAARFLIALVLAAAVITPGAVATDPQTLAGRVGHRVQNFVLVPMGSSARDLPVHGRPTVIAVFASWCPACHAEMPTLTDDARAFGSEAYFAGIDYGESSMNARGFVLDAGITFPTESLGSEPAEPKADGAPLVVHVPGGRLTTDALDTFRDAVPAQTYAALVEIANAQRSGGRVAALERRLRVYVEDLTSIPDVTEDALPLPHIFVIDGSGILRDEISGYDSREDRVRAALLRLGLVDRRHKM